MAIRVTWPPSFVGGFPAAFSRDDHTVARENVPSERGRALIIGDRAEKPAGVIGIAHAIAVMFGDRGEIPALVVLVLGHALIRGDGGEKPQLVIGVSLFLLPGAIYGNKAAVEVIGITGNIAVCVRLSLRLFAHFVFIEQFFNFTYTFFSGIFLLENLAIKIKFK